MTEISCHSCREEALAVWRAVAFSDEEAEAIVVATEVIAIAEGFAVISPAAALVIADAVGDEIRAAYLERSKV